MLTDLKQLPQSILPSKLEEVESVFPVSMRYKSTGDETLSPFFKRNNFTLLSLKEERDRLFGTLKGHRSWNLNNRFSTSSAERFFLTTTVSIVDSKSFVRDYSRLVNASIYEACILKEYRPKLFHGSTAHLRHRLESALKDFALLTNVVKSTSKSEMIRRWEFIDVLSTPSPLPDFRSTVSTQASIPDSQETHLQLPRKEVKRSKLSRIQKKDQNESATPAIIERVESVDTIDTISTIQKVIMDLENLSCAKAVKGEDKIDTTVGDIICQLSSVSLLIIFANCIYNSYRHFLLMTHVSNFAKLTRKVLSTATQ
jgi:hypothetical protein